MHWSIIATVIVFSLASVYAEEDVKEDTVSVEATVLKPDSAPKEINNDTTTANENQPPCKYETNLDNTENKKDNFPTPKFGGKQPVQLVVNTPPVTHAPAPAPAAAHPYPSYPYPYPHYPNYPPTTRRPYPQYPNYPPAYPPYWYYSPGYNYPGYRPPYYPGYSGYPNYPGYPFPGFPFSNTSPLAKSSVNLSNAIAEEESVNVKKVAKTNPFVSLFNFRTFQK